MPEAFCQSQRSAQARYSLLEPVKLGMWGFREAGGCDAWPGGGEAGLGLRKWGGVGGSTRVPSQLRMDYKRCYWSDQAWCLPVQLPLRTDSATRGPHAVGWALWQGAGVGGSPGVASTTTHLLLLCRLSAELCSQLWQGSTGHGCARAGGPLCMAQWPKLHCHHYCRTPRCLPVAGHMASQAQLCSYTALGKLRRVAIPPCGLHTSRPVGRGAPLSCVAFLRSHCSAATTAVPRTAFLRSAARLHRQAGSSSGGGCHM